MNVLVFIAFMGGVLYLAYWIKDKIRQITIQRKLAELECERMGHIIHRVYAYGDPRWPVDKCSRCPWQHPVRFQCPHCGEEIKMKGAVRGS